MNSRLRVLAVALAAVALQSTARAQGSLSPPGPPSATMRSLDQIEPRTVISALPFEVTQPGSYVVVRNLSGSSSGIAVSASNVKIDLNGFTLTGDRLVFGHGIVVVPGCDDVAVEGGAVQDWGGDGVHASGCSNVSLERLHVARCVGDAVEVGSVTARDVDCVGNTGAGLRLGSGLSGGKVSLSDLSFTRARSNGAGGIVAQGDCAVHVRGGEVCDNGGDGISLAASAAGQRPSLSVEDCVINDNSGDALSLPGVGDVCYDLTVKGCSALRNAGRGIDVSNSSVTGRGRTAVAALACTAGGNDGIRVAGPCDVDVTDSVVSDNAGHGVVWASTAAGQEGRVRLERCSVDRNTGRGLSIEESALVRVVCSTRGSSFRNNGGDGIAVLLTHVAAGLQLDLREGASSGNGGNGMNVIEGDCKDNGNVLVDIVFAFNALDGGCKNDCGAAPSLFSRVVARGNGGRGLAVEGGTWTFEDCSVVDNLAAGVQGVPRTLPGNNSSQRTLYRFRNCDLSGNGGVGLAMAPDAGGGAYKVAMQDMHFRKNGGGGASFVGSCDVTVDGADASGNTGHGLAWASLGGGGGTAGTPAAASSVQFVLRRFLATSNSASGLFISEGGDVDADCDFADCAFDRNGADGVTLLLTDPNSRLDIVHRGGGACDNVGYGLHLAAGRSSRQGFFDLALSRNGVSGAGKIDCEPSEGVFENVVAQSNGAHGLDLTGGTWSIGRCTVSDNTGRGIVYGSRHLRLKHVSLLKLYDCDLERNGGDGLYVHTTEDDAGYKVVFQDMHFRSNAGNGVSLDCSHALSSVAVEWLDSSASGNGACGMLINPIAMDKGLRFRAKGGDCDDNVLAGISVSDVSVTACVVSDLSLRRNGGPGLSALGGTWRIERCVAVDNGGDGFLFTRPPTLFSRWGELVFESCDAVHNGGSGLAVAGYDQSALANISVGGGLVSGNALHGLDLATSPGARGRVHAVHFGDNGVHGLVSSASSLDVCDNQFTQNAEDGVCILAGSAHVVRNVVANHRTGVFLAAPGSTVLQNTFSGSSGGLAQVPIEDLSGACDIAPLQNAATGTNPLGNLVF